jgi:hypothetical protein
MRFNAPKKMTWWIACTLLILGVVAFLLPLLGVGLPFAWLPTLFFFASAVLYAAATALKGL